MLRLLDSQKQVFSYDFPALKQRGYANLRLLTSNPREQKIPETTYPFPRLLINNYKLKGINLIIT